MKVLHLVISLAPGGLERLVVNWTLARNAREPGSTRVACLDERGELAGALPADAVVSLAARRVRRPFDPAAVWRLRRALRGVQVLHTHNTAAWFYGALGTWGTGTVHVHTEHGTNVYTEGAGNRLRNAFALRRTARLAAVSAHTADCLATELGVAPERFKVVPNGVPPHHALSNAAFASLRARWGVGDDDTVIGSVGRLDAVKSYDRLLRAFAVVKVAALPDVGRTRLLLVGDGEERGALQALADDLGVGADVVFAGLQTEARDFYDLMDLFVLPSRSEGLSIALLEAMAAGVPVLVTDVGESRAVVDDGRCGTVLPEDPAQWPEAIARVLLRDEAEDERESAAARRRVAESYSNDASVDAYETVYRDAMLQCR